MDSQIQTAIPVREENGDIRGLSHARGVGELRGRQRSATQLSRFCLFAVLTWLAFAPVASAAPCPPDKYAPPTAIIDASTSATINTAVAFSGARSLPGTHYWYPYDKGAHTCDEHFASLPIRSFTWD